jgi:hypothetical protein
VAVAGVVTARLWMAIVVGLSFVASAASAGVPAKQTFNRAKFHLSFELPSDWAGGWTSTSTKTIFSGVAPGRVAQVQITILNPPLQLPPLAVFAASLATGERTRLKAAPGASVTSHSTTIGGVPAIELTERYHGLWVSAPGEIQAYLYVFEHRGVAYVLNFSTTSDWLSKERPIFTASVASLHFTNVA